MAVEMYGDVMEEQAAPQSTAMMRAPARSVQRVEVLECDPVDVEVLPAEQGDDAELDEIIDRVIEVVKARRAGKPVPPRRARGQMVANPSTELAGADATKMNPNTKALVYAGVGVGAVALIGGLWWYFKKK
jgi:hypothetical protein